MQKIPHEKSTEASLSLVLVGMSENSLIRAIHHG